MFDGLSGPPDASERANRRSWSPINPAASILPIVERVAPERLEEVFWKAVAQMPRSDPAQTETFLAVTTARWPTCSSCRPRQLRPNGPDRDVWYVWAVIQAKAAIDPRGAVAMFEAMPPVGPGSAVRTNRLIDQARDALITGLIEPLDEPWKAVWSRSGVPVDKPRFR